VSGHPADHPGPFALVGDLDAPALAPDDEHHLARVLRLRGGDALVLGDGRGAWRPARFGRPVEPAGEIERAPRPSPEIGVGFALVKGTKPELVVQKLTELGVDRIVPFRAARSVLRWDAAKAAAAVVRWRAVARAATQQSHRPWLPEVEEVAELDGLLARDGVALAARAGDAPTLAHRLVLVGPEGGWAPEEEAAADRLGVPRVALGGHVLRAETASVAVGVLLSAMRAGLVS
jgi:16S rRNA (uracil1498-N3)-methyltransferase